MTKLAVGQQVRIVNYNHPWCGEYGAVMSVHSGGDCAMIQLWRFPERRVAVWHDSVCTVPGDWKFTGTEVLPEFSRASHSS
jgi:hypothetical protein